MSHSDNTWNRRNIVLVILIALGAAYGLSVWRYSLVLEAVDRSRWTSETGDDLERIWNELMTYAAQHDGRLPQSEPELVDIGLLSKDEFDYVEPTRHVHIVRHYRPVPRVDLPAELLIMTETYHPSVQQVGDYYLAFRCVSLNGPERPDGPDDELSRHIARDNDLRESLGLTPIPIGE